MASSWNVRRHPILSASEPPVNEPTVAPANVELTTHPNANREHVSEQQNKTKSRKKSSLTQPKSEISTRSHPPFFDKQIQFTQVFWKFVKVCHQIP